MFPRDVPLSSFHVLILDRSMHSVTSTVCLHLAMLGIPKIYFLPFFLERAPAGGLLRSGAVSVSSVTTLLRSRASSTFPAPWLPLTPSCIIA